MSLRVAIQMDPIAAIDIEADSTFALALEAQQRGHELLYYLPRHLSMRDGEVYAKAQKLTLRREHGNHHDLGDEGVLNLRDVDVVLMRQDPPFGGRAAAARGPL